MPQRDWNESYSSGEVPWDTGKPDALLVDTVRNGTVPPGRVLEVGCGTGTNANWLASQGFTVLGIDVAPLAIEKARKKATEVGADCRFEVLDLLKDQQIPGGPYDFVFDRGCFHIFDSAEERTLFAQRVEAQLKHGGQWLSLIGSTEGPEREFGPPRRSARDVTNAVEPAMEILQLRSAVFHADIPEAAAAWYCLSRKRSIPAVPSTRRVA